MTTQDFSFGFRRTVPVLVQAEDVPAVTDTTMVWDLPELVSDAPYSGLHLLCTRTMNFELGFWNASSASLAAWVVVATGTLAANISTVVPFPAPGARIYVRNTGILGASAELYCAATTESVGTVNVNGVVVNPASEDRQVANQIINATKTVPASPAPAECVVPGNTPCSVGVTVQADLANTGVVSVGKVGVTVGAGLQFRKGDSKFYHVSDASMIFCVSTAAGDKLQIEVT